jgi:hypothetical protein
MNCARCGSPLSSLSSTCPSCGAAVGGGPPALSATGFVRPALITLVAVLQFIGAGVSLLAAAAYFAVAALGDTPGVVLIGAAMLGASGAVQLACAIGLWRLRPWGRTIALVLSWIGLLAVPIGTIVSALLLYYLFRPGIRLIFSGRAPGTLTAEERGDVAAVSGRSTVLIVVVVVLLVLCLVAVLGIIAAIAVPGLMRARVAANEAAAVATLRTIVIGQTAYAGTCGGGYFAPSLARLGVGPAEGGGSPFVPPDLGADPVRKNGYIFLLTPGPSEADAPASCNGEAAGRLVRTYFVGAEPAEAAGGKFFGVTADGTIYESPSALPVTLSGAPQGGVPVR